MGCECNCTMGFEDISAAALDDEKKCIDHFKNSALFGFCSILKDCLLRFGSIVESVIDFLHQAVCGMSSSPLGPIPTCYPCLTQPTSSSLAIKDRFCRGPGFQVLSAQANVQRPVPARRAWGRQPLPVPGAWRKPRPSPTPSPTASRPTPPSLPRRSDLRTPRGAKRRFLASASALWAPWCFPPCVTALASLGPMLTRSRSNILEFHNSADVPMRFLHCATLNF